MHIIWWVCNTRFSQRERERGGGVGREMKGEREKERECVDSYFDINKG